jgi:hypothetical protein
MAAALCLIAATPATLDQLRAEQNPEHRAKLAVDYAALAERAAEAANEAGDDKKLASELQNVVAAIELARDSFAAAGKTPGRQPGSFKSAELKSHEILIRLADLRHKMDDEQRPLIDAPIAKVQDIHDFWFDGIMGKKK